MERGRHSAEGRDYINGKRKGENGKLCGRCTQRPYRPPLTAHRSPFISVLCTLYSVLRTLNPNKHEHSNKIIHSYTELERGRHDAPFPALCAEA